MRTDDRTTPGAAQQPTVGGDSWDGKTVLLAGATGGVFHAVTTKLIDHGATALVLPRSPEQPPQLDGGPREGALHHLSMDPCQPTDVSRVFAQIMDLGGVDVLINIAAPLGVGEGHIAGGPNTLERMFQVNVVVPVDLSTLLLPGMIERRSGRIVNVFSEVTIGCDVATHEAYIASKEALEAYTRRLAGGLSSTGVTANMLDLGDGSPRIPAVERPSQLEETAEEMRLHSTTGRCVHNGPIAKSQAVVRLLSRLLSGQTS